MSTYKQLVKTLARPFPRFTRRAGGITLRPYQAAAASAILESIRRGLGLSFVILMARQSGKDELAANLKAYLLARYVSRRVSIVEVNPTYKPQSLNAIDRLEDRLTHNLITRFHWQKHSGHDHRFGKARVMFLSGHSRSNVVGATASLLLLINEAQDIPPVVYDRKFAPMVSSTNATRVFMGTAWTSQTLLARELRHALILQKTDGLRRVFMVNADDVRLVLPAYGKYVDGEIARLGREHPLIKTQYFNEEIDSQSGMFNAARRLLMRSDSTLPSPEGEGSGVRSTDLIAQPASYIFTLDVAGQDENSMSMSPLSKYSSLSEAQTSIWGGAGAGAGAGVGAEPTRDSVTLTIHAVDLSMLETLRSPVFRAVKRFQWTGQNHLTVFGQLSSLADQYQPQYLVIDATGVGEGLWAMLDKHFPTSVIPVKFSQARKSEIGYRFLAMIETGRFRDCCDPRDPLSQIAERQYASCQTEILIGPGKLMRWGVPEGLRTENGELVHDDIIIADALITEADQLDWSLNTPALIAQAKDPLDEMGKSF